MPDPVKKKKKAQKNLQTCQAEQVVLENQVS